MGQGGEIVLINGTSKTWRKHHCGSYQMHAWQFPDTISSGGTAKEYVEFNHGVTTSRSDTGGECQYDFVGTDHAFELHVYDNPPRIEVEIKGSTPFKDPNGLFGELGNVGKIDLGWAHDGYVCFIVYEVDGKYYGMHQNPAWMQTHLSLLGNRPLRHICMPGTHDAGMSNIADLTPFAQFNDAMRYLTLTQSKSVRDQLFVGSRYFDLRPVLYRDQFYTGHYTDPIAGMRPGANGQSIDDIIDNVNDFTRNHAELIILDFSHTKHLEHDHRGFEESEWHQLMAKLYRINNLFEWPDTETRAKKLNNLCLNDFIGKGKAAVVCVMHAGDNVSLGKYSKLGFYTPKELSVRDDYSNTDDLDTMVNNQIEKLKAHRNKKDESLSLCSWTLTPQLDSIWPGVLAGKFLGGAIIGNMVTDKILVNNSVSMFAHHANRALMSRLYTTSGTFPNIIFVDYLEDFRITSLAMAFNVTEYGQLISTPKSLFEALAGVAVPEKQATATVSIANIFGVS